MRVTLNSRSTDQLNQVMDLMGYQNPTHCIQTMITSLLDSLTTNQSQSIEDNNHNGNCTSKGLHPMHN